MNNVFTKTLFDKRGFIVGWTLGFMFISYLMMIFYPAFQNNALDELAKNMPPALKGLLGNLALLKDINTYMGSELFEIRIPILTSIMAIILGIGLSVAEEEKGHLRTLATLPISRTSILVQKYAAIIVILCCITTGIVVGVYIGSLQIDLYPEFKNVLKLAVMTWLLMITITSIVFCLGIASGRRAIAMSVGTIIAVGSFLLTMFSKSVDWLEEYEKVSLLHYFPAVDIVQNGVQLYDITVFISIISILLVISLFFFRRRDIN